MAYLILDAGNGDIKFMNQDMTFHYSHNVAELTEAQWKQTIARHGDIPEGYIAIDGRFFVYGDKARKYQLRVKPSGATRYTRDYYGLLMCCAIAESFNAGSHQIELFASYPPRDINYRKRIEESSAGNWQFTTSKGVFNARVKVAGLFDEPLGGFYHRLLTSRLRPDKRSMLLGSTVLVIDVGSFTTDFTAIERTGEVDLTSMDSLRVGTLDVVTAYERELKAQYADYFQNGAELDSIRVFDSLMTGKYNYGKRALKTQQIADEAIMPLANDVFQLVTQMGGAINYDVLLMTGGGAMILMPYLERLQKGRDADVNFASLPIVTAESNAEHLRYANVFGGGKFYHLLAERNAL